MLSSEIKFTSHDGEVLGQLCGHVPQLTQLTPSRQESINRLFAVNSNGTKYVAPNPVTVAIRFIASLPHQDEDVRIAFQDTLLSCVMDPTKAYEIDLLQLREAEGKIWAVLDSIKQTVNMSDDEIQNQFQEYITALAKACIVVGDRVPSKPIECPITCQKVPVPQEKEVHALKHYTVSETKSSYVSRTINGIRMTTAVPAINLNLKTEL